MKVLNVQSSEKVRELRNFVVRENQNKSGNWGKRRKNGNPVKDV